MFNVHVIQALFGDSLLVEYGDTGSKFILIDGGPAHVYDDSLRPTLDTIVGSRKSLEAAVITHIDIDHIKGILDLLAELKAQKDNNEEPFLTVKDLWFNSFANTIDTDGTLSQRMNSIFSNAASNGINMASTGIAINGIKEGNKVSSFCNILGIPLNIPTNQEIFKIGSPSDPIVLENLEFIIVGPTQENIDKLKEEWDEWLANRENEMANGNFNILSMSDKSVPNLSSIMFLVKNEERSVLFTGDGRGDHLISGLKQKGLLHNGKMHVDILKVAHHGSDRNTDRGFFETVTADIYIISANGKDDNPDYATLTWIIESANAAGRNIKMVITNETPSTRKILVDYPSTEWGYSIKYIPQNKLSIKV